jgi:hypothetical protein
MTRSQEGAAEILSAERDLPARVSIVSWFARSTNYRCSGWFDTQGGPSRSPGDKPRFDGVPALGTRPRLMQDMPDCRRLCNTFPT